MTEVLARNTTRFWIGVVSRAHVQGGVAGSFAQLCHGKERPLRRMRIGDWLIYYSPRTEREGGTPTRAFTAIGRVVGEDVYPFAMSEAFVPLRRDVRYLPCREASIAPLLGRLSFIRQGPVGIPVPHRPLRDCRGGLRADRRGDGGRSGIGGKGGRCLRLSSRTTSPLLKAPVFCSGR